MSCVLLQKLDTYNCKSPFTHSKRCQRQGCAIGTDVIESRVIIASVFCFEKAANSCKVHIQWGEIQIACLHQLSKLHLAQSMYSPHQFHHHHCRNHLDQTIHVNQKQQHIQRIHAELHFCLTSSVSTIMLAFKRCCSCILSTSEIYSSTFSTSKASDFLVKVFVIVSDLEFQNREQ